MGVNPTLLLCWIKSQQFCPLWQASVLLIFLILYTVDTTTVLVLAFFCDINTMKDLLCYYDKKLNHNIFKGRKKPFFFILCSKCSCKTSECQEGSSLCVCVCVCASQEGSSLSLCVCVCVCISGGQQSLSVCVCVCVHLRRAAVCVCVCERERKSPAAGGNQRGCALHTKRLMLL